MINPYLGGVRRARLPYPYLTHYTPPLAHPRCANEYFSKSKWILCLSQMCWHRLQLYRWGIGARHAQSRGVMYRCKYYGLRSLQGFISCSNRRRSHVEDLAAVTKDFRKDLVGFALVSQVFFSSNGWMQYLFYHFNICSISLKFEFRSGTSANRSIT